jgi:hypothetical protein
MPFGQLLGLNFIKPVRRNNMDSSSHNGIRSLDSRQRMRCLVGRKCEAEVFMLFRHGP